jgi:acetyl/propionyl-CoA carboxylase alpha subunit
MSAQGTVEFVADASGEHFLEVNARLQVQAPSRRW